MDDPGDAAACGLIDQGAGAVVVDGRGRPRAAADLRGAVDQGVDPVATAAQRGGIGEIPVHGLDAGPDAGRGVGTAVERGAVRHQSQAGPGDPARGGHDMAADESGRSGDEDARRRHERMPCASSVRSGESSVLVKTGSPSWVARTCTLVVDRVSAGTIQASIQQGRSSST